MNTQTEAGVKIHYRTDGDFFNLCRLKSYTKVTRAIVRDFLFADDCPLAAHSEVDLQELADCFATAAMIFGLTVSIKKTQVLRQLAPNTAWPPPNITMDGNALKNVDTFKYLGSCINSAANLDDEVLCRISGCLHTRVWHERGISIKTKLSVYRAVVLPSLLYLCKNLTCYRRHIKKLDQFHLRCLHKVLRVSWKDHVPNQEILHKAELTGIEVMLNLAQLRWSGHVTCMDDSRLPKQLFHAELSTGKRHKGGQRKQYKDVLKSTLQAYNIPVDEWQALAQDRHAWTAAIRNGTRHFERSRLQSLDDKRLARKNGVPNPSTAVPCQLCGKICASTFGLQAHMRKHQHCRVIFEIKGLTLLLGNESHHKTLDSLVSYIESKKARKRSISQLTSSQGAEAARNHYQKQRSSSVREKTVKCTYCGEAGHGKGFNKPLRKEQCPAYGHMRQSCTLKHHFSSVCRSKSRPNPRQATPPRTSSNSNDTDGQGAYMTPSTPSVQ